MPSGGPVLGSPLFLPAGQSQHRPFFATQGRWLHRHPLATPREAPSLPKTPGKGIARLGPPTRKGFPSLRSVTAAADALPCSVSGTVPAQATE